MKILGIETSCDETAVAIVTDRREILSSLVQNQNSLHRATQGVVPEIAARAHLERLPALIRQAVAEASLASLDDIDAIAATAGPGLIGGVMVGLMAAKGMALVARKPLIAVNHLEGHALTVRLTDDVAFPYLLLLVSGGHTQFLSVEGVGRYRRLGTTIDDAAGEAFDKTAKLLGLGYPGGPAVEAAAAACSNPQKARARFPLPRPLAGRPGCDFSFSGLKTAVRRAAGDRALAPGFDDAPIRDIAFSFQETVADIMADRARNALDLFRRQYPDAASPLLVVAGGVAANKRLRQALENAATEKGFGFTAPPLHLCGDNAAMIAWAGVERFRLGLTDDLRVLARPRWPLDPAV